MPLPYRSFGNGARQAQQREESMGVALVCRCCHFLAEQIIGDGAPYSEGWDGWGGLAGAYGCGLAGRAAGDFLCLYICIVYLRLI